MTRSAQRERELQRKPAGGIGLNEGLKGGREVEPFLRRAFRQRICNVLGRSRKPLPAP
jgi:hypothetical protein